jgi:hypothetical protein
MVVCICEQTSNDRVEMLIPDENGLLEFYVSAVSIVRIYLTPAAQRPPSIKTLRSLHFCAYVFFTAKAAKRISQKKTLRSRRLCG